MAKISWKNTYSQMLHANIHIFPFNKTRTNVMIQNIFTIPYFTWSVQILVWPLILLDVKLKKKNIPNPTLHDSIPIQKTTKKYFRITFMFSQISYRMSTFNFIWARVYVSINKNNENAVKGMIMFVEKINPSDGLYGKRRKILNSTKVSRIVCFVCNFIVVRQC